MKATDQFMSLAKVSLALGSSAWLKKKGSAAKRKAWMKSVIRMASL